MLAEICGTSMGNGLLIRVLSLNGKPLSQPISGVFDENGGSIGRADSNTVALPDTERLISRLHARVTWSGGAFWLEDVGKGVSSLVNGRPISGEGAVKIGVNDELRIGGYRLMVDLLDADGASLLRQKTISRQRPRLRAEPASIGEGEVAIVAITRPRPVADPFSDLLSGISAPPQNAPSRDALGQSQQGSASLPAVPVSNDPFADFNLFGNAKAPGQSAPAHASQNPDPFADLLAPAAAPAAAGVPVNMDPFADLGVAPAPVAAPAVDP